MLFKLLDTNTAPQKSTAVFGCLGLEQGVRIRTLFQENRKGTTVTVGLKRR